MLRSRPIIGRFVQLHSSANTMDRLPDEVVLHIFAYLHVPDLVHLQLVSSRYLTLGRDSALWKLECFNHSQAERLRRRRHLLNIQDPRLAEIRNAVTALPGGDLTAEDVSQLLGRSPSRAAVDPAAEARLQRVRALASWEPGYPGEEINYYEEFIQRHAPINIGWLELPNSGTSDKEQFREATGIGLLRDNQESAAQHAVAPLDDGSICIWDISERTTYGASGGGRLLGQSNAGRLTGCSPASILDSHTIMTETGAVECVSIDGGSRKGYFGVQNQLHEVDLHTLQVSSTRVYPFPVTALSEAKDRVPLTVGTNMTVHLFDPRDSAFTAGVTTSTGELIGGSVYSHATLAQPGPLSILHQADLGSADSSIWIGGRFTSLLNYDRRFFPRLRGTTFSGARIACLSSQPRPWIPRDLDLIRNPNAAQTALSEAKHAAGITLIAAGEYKGKGSLEFYPLPAAAQPYQNRQTASASKLLSVAPHGGRYVFSDGDGQLKWVERDGFVNVRTFNINDSLPKEVPNIPQRDLSTGIFSTSNDLPGQGDIVQKILPLGLHFPHPSAGRFDIGQEKLLLWTGDGRLGVLGMGQTNPLGNDEWHDAVEEQVLSVEERAREDAERQHAMAMRRALERQANEVRFVRGLGMGYMR